MLEIKIFLHVVISRRQLRTSHQILVSTYMKKSIIRVAECALQRRNNEIMGAIIHSMRVLWMKSACSYIEWTLEAKYEKDSCGFIKSTAIVWEQNNLNLLSQRKHTHFAQRHIQLNFVVASATRESPFFLCVKEKNWNTRERRYEKNWIKNFPIDLERL